MSFDDSEQVGEEDLDGRSLAPGMTKDVATRYFEAECAFPDAEHKRMTSQQRRERADQALMARHLLATHIVTDLPHYKPKPVFMRPPEVPDDDVEAWSSARQVKLKGERAQQMDKDTARALGQWRAETSTIEADNSGLLVVLVEAVQTFLAVGDPSNQHQVDALMEHLEKVWKIDPHDVPLKTMPRRELEAWCDRKCRRSDVCPSWLLNGGTPPKFSPRGYVGTSDPAKDAAARDRPKPRHVSGPESKRPVWEDAMSRLGEDNE